MFSDEESGYKNSLIKFTIRNIGKFFRRDKFEEMIFNPKNVFEFEHNLKVPF